MSNRAARTVAACLREWSCLGAWLAAAALAAARAAEPVGSPPQWAEIRVVDSATGRGVPLVTLETVHGLQFVTDNAGRVAFCEPGLLGRELFFFVRGQGYSVPQDGFGFAGVRITPQPGAVVQINVERELPAERLCRLTGEGFYRDSLLLGYEAPQVAPTLRGGVAGQDSVAAAIYRGKLYWFWGDTQRLEYPLGLFRVAGATTPLWDADAPAFDPAVGIPFEYFVGPGGFARTVLPLPERPEGVVWVSAVCVVPDADDHERLVAHYTRRRGLAEELEQGLAVFNDEREIFEPRVQLPLEETWRRPRGHPILYTEDGVDWLLFGSPAPNVRVRATLAAVLDPSQYEAWTCLAEASEPARPRLAADGRPAWRWQRDLPPVGSAEESRWLKSGLLSAEFARYCPADVAAPEDRVELHSGTVRWNAFRKKWILVAGQVGGRSSLLGEVWYAEADHPTGPFSRAAHVVTHDRQSFYNVCQHAFLDADGGRTIHFEGTYTQTFSGNPERTPRYEYNQMLYRLDLGSPALRTIRGD